MTDEEIHRKLFEKHYESVPQDDDYYYFYKHLAIRDSSIFGTFKNNTLLFSYPYTFNDPFDCMFEIEIDHDHDKLDLELFLKMSILDESYAAASQDLTDYIDSKVAEFKKKFRTQYSVSCFNANPLSILMWSHYADHHKGFMMEFRVPKNSEMMNMPLPVDYRQDFPIINLNWNIKNFLLDDDGFRNLKIAQDMALVKSSEWHYEKEFRYVENTNGLIEYEPETLCSVVLGSKFDFEHENYKLLIDSVNEFNRKNKSNVQVFKSKLASRKFELTVPNHPRLDTI